MIYVFIALLILVFSFIIALISLIRDSTKLENFNKAKVAESEESTDHSPETVAQQAVPIPEPQTTSSPKPIETETVPFPWEQKGTGLQNEEKKKEPLPWEAPDSGFVGSKGALSGEISLKDLKNSN